MPRPHPRPSLTVPAIAALAVSACLATTACSSGPKPRPRVTASTVSPAPARSPLAGATTTAAPAPAPTHRADVASYLLPVPAGANAAAPFPGKRGPVSVAPGGSLTAAQVASLSPNTKDDGAALLASHGFARAAAVTWTAADGTSVLVELLQFTPGTQSIDYFATETADASAQFSPTSRHVLGSIPEAITLSDASPDVATGIVRSYSYLLAGDVVAVVITAAHAAVPDVDAAEALLRQQFARL